MEEMYITGGEVFYREPEKNPLMIDLILTSTFDFLNVESLKSCRLVCTLWKRISNSYLRKRSRIVFNLKDSKDEDCWENFNKTFPESCRPFTAIRIKLQGHISFRKFEEILKGRKDHVTDLALRNILLTDDNGVNISSYDISHIIPQILDNFCVLNNSNGYTHFMVSSEKMFFFQSLDLYKCTVILGDTANITAKEISLDHVTFTQNALLSEFINFSQVKKLNFRDISNKVSLILNGDSCGVPTIPNNIILDLCHANIMDSNWYVDQLRVSKTVFENYLLCIKDLTIRCSSLDIAALPNSIEVLNLGPNTQITCSQRICFNSLKSLSLTGNLSSIVDFRNCPNLTNLTLAPDNDGPCNFNLNDIPVKVNRIKVLQDYHCKIEWVGYPAHQLDTLAVSDCRWDHLTSVLLHKIQPTHLVVNINSISVTASQINSLVQNSLFQDVVIGPIYWREDEHPIYKWPHRVSEYFKNSSLFSTVNLKSPYYLFTNKRGIAIDKQEFYSMLTPACH